MKFCRNFHKILSKFSWNFVEIFIKFCWNFRKMLPAHLGLQQCDNRSLIYRKSLQYYSKHSLANISKISSKVSKFPSFIQSFSQSNTKLVSKTYLMFAFSQSFSKFTKNYYFIIFPNFSKIFSKKFFIFLIIFHKFFQKLNENVT